MVDLDDLLLEAAGRTNAAATRRRHSHPSSSRRREGSFSDGGSDSRDDSDEDRGYPASRKPSVSQVPLKKRLEAEREARAEGGYGDGTSDRENYEVKAFKKMSKSSAQLQLINEQVTNVKAIEKDLKAQKAKLSEDGAAYKSLEAKVVERERTVRQLHESLKQLEKEKEVMFDDWTKQLNELKLEVESGRRQLEARQNDVESVVTMVDENTAKTTQVKQSGEANVKQLAAKYQEIVKQFHEYAVSFGAVLPSL